MEHPDLELSAYLDEELSGDERARVEAHLAGCALCRATLEDLRRIVRRARARDDRPPERDLWPAIAARLVRSAPDVAVVPIERARERRRLTFTVPQLAAAAAVLMALSAGASALLLREARAPEAVVAGTQLGVEAAGIPIADLPPAVQPAVASYDAAIREMELTLLARRGRLDTATVRVLEQSLAVIDSAIAQARDALARDPYNRYLNRHLQRALDRKLDVLRRAATLPAVT
jgi:hypothetical protein